MTYLKIIAYYCLPALLGLCIITSGYYQRTQSVSEVIKLYKQRVESNTSGVSLLGADDKAGDGAAINRLIRYLEGDVVAHQHGDKTIKIHNMDDASVRAILRDVWLGNAMFIATMVMLPYILFASRLAFSNRITLTAQERIDTTKTNWWMKLIIACVITLGWIYVLNPSGRGESTLQQFLIKVDLSQSDSLPLYIRSIGMAPVVAGFLGWYLYMLSYFFSKLVHHDVVSARVYSLMFKKFLFTYGIAMIIPSIEVSAAAAPYVSTGQGQSALMFFIGYFPMAAFSMLKEKGLKLGGDLKTDTGYLSQLPGISRWQVLRLEEEGIDNMAALAYCSQKRLHESLLSMSTILDLWIDVAQLYVVVGHDAYQQLQVRCKSASGFIHQVESNDVEFMQFVQQKEIGDAAEISRLLQRTFGHKLIAYSG